jgi:hypothetical protein
LPPKGDTKRFKRYFSHHDRKTSDTAIYYTSIEKTLNPKP